MWKFITPENDYGELLTGETTISFVSKGLANSNLKNGFIESSHANKPFGIELAMVTENVQAIIDNAIELGANAVEQPVQKPWGQMVGYIRDIDGFLIEVCSSMQ